MREHLCGLGDVNGAHVWLNVFTCLLWLCVRRQPVRVEAFVVCHGGMWGLQREEEGGVLTPAEGERCCEARADIARKRRLSLRGGCVFASMALRKYVLSSTCMLPKSQPRLVCG